jgi:hypothetical protein
MRALAAAIALSLLTIAALAASPQVEAALNAFRTVGTDANRLKTFCELMEIEEENQERWPPPSKQRWINCSMSLERISKQLGRASKMLIQHPTTARYFMLH